MLPPPHTHTRVRCLRHATAGSSAGASVAPIVVAVIIPIAAVAALAAGLFAWRHAALKRQAMDDLMSVHVENTWEMHVTGGMAAGGTAAVGAGSVSGSQVGLQLQLSRAPSPRASTSGIGRGTRV